MTASFARPARRVALAAVALLSAGPASAAAPPQEPAPRAAPPAPRPIPVELVFTAGDELDDLLHRAEEAAAVDPVLEEVERQLREVSEAAQRLRPGLEPGLLEEASAREIERLRQALGRGETVLSDGQAALERCSAPLVAVTREIQERRATWQLTAEAVRRERAPPAVLRRVAQAERSLGAAEELLRGGQERLLALQGRVSDARAEMSRSTASVEKARANLERQLFELESAPLWRALAAPNRAAALAGQLRQALRDLRRDVTVFLAEEQGRIWIHLAGVVAIGLGLLALRKPVAGLKDEEGELRGAALVLSRPWSAALLLSLPLAGWIYPQRSPALGDLLYLFLLGPLVRLLPRLLREPLRRPLYGLAALLALDRLAALAPPRTLLARLAVLLVAAAGSAGLAAGLRRRGWVRHMPRWARAAAVVALGLLAVSLVANAVGNATLAERLTHATVASATLGALLFGVEVVLNAALAALLHLPALQRRLLVARHRTLLRRRAASLVRLGLLALWAWLSAAVFGVSGTLGQAAGAVLGLHLRVGGLDVSLGNAAAFAVTLALTVPISRAVRFLLDEGVFAEVQLPRGVNAAVSTTAQYFVLVVGFAWAVLASGMEASRFSFLLGALGVGVGFGLQNVVNNFVSGLILLYERPLQTRDVIEVAGVSGEVTRIGVRSSTVRTFDGAEVIVPNATLVSSAFTNWTLSDRRRRIELGVGVAYGTEPGRVIELLLAALRGRAGVLESPAPAAFLLRFGDSSVDFALRFWTGDVDRTAVLASDVLVEVYASLGRAGIEIPFPQRDLHLRSIDPGAAEAVARAGGGAGGRVGKPGGT